ncbi:hypothetical protein Tco_0695178 [Tanacetum coccineum]
MKAKLSPRQVVQPLEQQQQQPPTPEQQQQPDSNPSVQNENHLAVPNESQAITAQFLNIDDYDGDRGLSETSHLAFAPQLTAQNTRQARHSQNTFFQMPHPQRPLFIGESSNATFHMDPLQSGMHIGESSRAPEWPSVAPQFTASGMHIGESSRAPEWTSVAPQFTAQNTPQMPHLQTSYQTPDIQRRLVIGESNNPPRRRGQRNPPLLFEQVVRNLHKKLKIAADDLGGMTVSLFSIIFTIKLTLFFITKVILDR